MSFPEIDPQVFVVVRRAYLKAEEAGDIPDLTEAELWTLVIIPAIRRIGDRFDNLPLQAPDQPEIRFYAMELSDGRGVALQARRRPDGVIVVENAEVTP